jgi:hypothetical protein
VGRVFGEKERTKEAAEESSEFGRAREPTGVAHPRARWCDLLTLLSLLVVRRKKFSPRWSWLFFFLFFFFLGPLISYPMLSSSAWKIQKTLLPPLTAGCRRGSTNDPSTPVS